MKNTNLIKIVDTLPTVLEKTTFDIQLQGWPAAITAIAFFTSVVSIYALNITHHMESNSPQDAVNAA